jgi:energy-converting hydrogenase A subunit M
MLGDWDRLVAYGGHFSSLEIDSEDVCTIIAQSKRCASLIVHMNYIDKQVKRKILVNTLNETIEVDLVDSFISINGVKEYCIVDRDQTYKDMHSSILGSNNNHACSFNDGLKVVDMIDSVERSINKRVWIDNLFTVRRPK